MGDSYCSYCVYLRSQPDRVKNGDWLGLIIFFIVSACCQGPEGSSKLDKLKLNAFKASQQFINI